jgi:hypothetical protein
MKEQHHQHTWLLQFTWHRPESSVHKGKLCSGTCIWSHASTSERMRVASIIHICFVHAAVAGAITAAPPSVIA